MLLIHKITTDSTDFVHTTSEEGTFLQNNSI